MNAVRRVRWLSRNVRYVRVFAALLLGTVVPGTIYAQASDALPDEIDRRVGERVFGDEWKEGDVRFPDAPRDGDLLEFHPNARGKLTFFLDRRSLSLGGDEIVRYTVVVKSATSQNTFYEGLRCETREFQTYAYARRDGRWRAATNRRWQPIKSRRGPSSYRFALYDGIMCDEFAGLPVRPKEIPPRMKGRDDFTIRGKD